ncbi:MAG: class I SAM-dependent methyltransferase [Desulfobacterales bacterium]|nr:class I SAM-dependent methyltransferase [Desulfobacterales bacterium]
MQNSATVVVTPKAEKSLLRRHPWIFSGAVRQAPAVAAGAMVAVRAADGRFLAWGAHSPESQIRVRVWSFEEHEAIDAGFFQRRLAEALAARRQMPLLSPCTAVRLVHGESDGLPGLIVDRYADFLVCQFLSAGAEHWKATIVAELERLLPCRGIYERSDADVRAKEGLPLASGVLCGMAPPDLLEIRAGEVALWADLVRGHKTGLYLDQRENQALVAAFSPGAEMLNCFCYTGGFGLWALRAGARQVIQADASADVLALARRNAQLNGLDDGRAEYVAANVFELLRTYRDSRRQFDLIVLDPPKFVASAAQMDKGCRGYKDINLLAFKLLRPGGVLLTFSCSGLVAPPLFQKIVADAAADAGRTVRVIGHLHQAADHPVSLNFPEAHYLKGLVCLAA